MITFIFMYFIIVSIEVHIWKNSSMEKIWLFLKSFFICVEILRMSFIDLLKLNYSVLGNKHLKESLKAILWLFKVFLSTVVWLTLLSHSAASLHLHDIQRPSLSSNVILPNDQTEMKGVSTALLLIQMMYQTSNAKLIESP